MLKMTLKLFGDSCSDNSVPTHANEAKVTMTRTPSAGIGGPGTGVK